MNSFISIASSIIYFIIILIILITLLYIGVYSFNKKKNKKTDLNYNKQHIRNKSIFITLFILSLLWAIFVIFIGIVMYSWDLDTYKKNIIEVNTEIKPFVYYFEKFKKENKRLPTQKEFDKWVRYEYNNYSVEPQKICHADYIRKLENVTVEDEYKFKGINWQTDYAISYWNGDSFDYYLSWKKFYDVSIYTKEDARKELIITILIGILPLILLFSVRRIKNIRNKNKIIKKQKTL